MKINILQKGGYKNHEVIDEAARYYAKQLMSTRMSNTLSLRIEIRSTTVADGADGTCQTVAKGSKANKDFTIAIQKNLALVEQLEVLAHEMVHVWQKATNTLQYRQWKSDKKIHARWNGEDVGLYDAIPYKDRPWEKEAYALENILFRGFKVLKKAPEHCESIDEKIKLAIKSVKNKRDASLEMSL